MQDVIRIWADWLRPEDGRKGFSQFGEEGFLHAIFNRLGETNRWCCEVGAGDGCTLSNVRQFILDGWDALLIEKNTRDFGLCRLEYERNPSVICRNLAIDRFNFEDTLLSNGYPHAADLLVIDIDGDDYYVWKSLEKVRPRVVMCEILPHFAEWEEMLENMGVKMPPQQQAPAGPILDLGHAKGYEPLVQTFCNIIFKRGDL